MENDNRGEPSQKPESLSEANSEIGEDGAQQLPEQSQNVSARQMRLEQREKKFSETPDFKLDISCAFNESELAKSPTHGLEKSHEEVAEQDDSTVSNYSDPPINSPGGSDPCSSSGRQIVEKSSERSLSKFSTKSMRTNLKRGYEHLISLEDEALEAGETSDEAVKKPNKLKIEVKQELVDNQYGENNDDFDVEETKKSLVLQLNQYARDEARVRSVVQARSSSPEGASATDRLLDKLRQLSIGYYGSDFEDEGEELEQVLIDRIEHHKQFADRKSRMSELMCSALLDHGSLVFLQDLHSLTKENLGGFAANEEKYFTICFNIDLSGNAPQHYGVILRPDVNLDFDLPARYRLEATLRQYIATEAARRNDDIFPDNPNGSAVARRIDAFWLIRSGKFRAETKPGDGRDYWSTRLKFFSSPHVNMRPRQRAFFTLYAEVLSSLSDPVVDFDSYFLEEILIDSECDHYGQMDYESEYFESLFEYQPERLN